MINSLKIKLNKFIHIFSSSIMFVFNLNTSFHFHYETCAVTSLLMSSLPYPSLKSPRIIIQYKYHNLPKSRLESGNTYTAFTNSIMQIISALFGRKIGRDQNNPHFFDAAIIRIISASEPDFGICERNSKIMQIISKVRSKVTLSPPPPTLNPSF